MRTHLIGLLCAAAALLGSAHAAERPPNLVLIVADDLGPSDLGAFGGEIRTPNLDALALEGVRFTNFYAAATCSPTRAMLLTGVDHHVAGVGSMAEMLTPAQIGQPGYEGVLTDRAASLAERLARAGYRTYQSGKWHLGLTAETSPKARGFERSFALLPGGAGHFDSSPLSERAPKVIYREDGAPVEAPTEGFYSSDFFTSKLISYLEEGAQDQRPFFAYLTFTAPHWPLQAPDEDIARYRGRYDAGFEALRVERLRRQKDLGLLPKSADIKSDPALQAAWDSLSSEERAASARAMEVYAAMVDRLDQNVGRLLAALDRLGEKERTIVVFLSDNGPEGHELRHLGLSDWVARTFDNSLANIGKRGSYVMYGPGWAQAASAPSRLYKGFPTEGGLRVPAIVWGLPGAGRVVEDALTVRDVAPTLLDFAGAGADPAFEGRAPIEGVSFRPALGAGSLAGERVLAWELFGKRAVREGRYKAVWLPPPHGDGAWRLYDLASDPGENVDLSRKKPKLAKRLAAEWEAYAARVGVKAPGQEIIY